MTRIFLASIGFAVLLGAPQPASAADLGPRGESLRTVPTSEAPPKGTLTPAAPGTDEVRSVEATFFVAVASSGLDLRPARAERGVDAPPGSIPAAARSLLPLPRAPPA